MARGKGMETVVTVSRAHRIVYVNLVRERVNESLARYQAVLEGRTRIAKGTALGVPYPYIAFYFHPGRAITISTVRYEATNIAHLIQCGG